MSEQEKRKAERLKERNKALEVRRKRQRERGAVKESQRRAEELSAMNNIRTKKQVTSKNKLQVGSSASNNKWRSKGVKRYNERVWRGWRESDGEQSPVVTYKASEIEKADK